MRQPNTLLKPFGPQILIQALRAAIPSLDLAHLSMNPLGEGKGSIVFADEISLDKNRLAVLGLR